MTTVLWAGTSDGMRTCDARCHDATGPDCKCICGGVNHGVGLEKALKNNDDFAELLPRIAEILDAAGVEMHISAALSLEGS